VGRTAVRASASIRPWRDNRSGLGLLFRSQPRPRTTQETRRLLPTSATIPQSKSTPDETPIPRAERTVSAPSAALDGITAGATSSTAFGTVAPLAPEGVRPHWPAGREPAMSAQWRQRPTHFLPNTSRHPRRRRKTWSFSADTERAKTRLRSAARTVRTCHESRCLRSPEAAPGALGPEGPIEPEKALTRLFGCDHAIFHHSGRVALTG
jgi:hypothetical protein